MYKEIIQNSYGTVCIAHDGKALPSLSILHDAVPTAKLSALGKQTDTQLKEYFQGKRKIFTLPLDPQLTGFTCAACLALADIPYGHTLSYRELAVRLGKPKACRAIGNAIGKNPLPILLPCHRVIRTDGSLGGFSLGLDIKRDLLRMEAAAWRE